MEKGDYVYIKGPRGSFSHGFAGEIGEIIEITKEVYPHNEPGERDLYRVAIEPEALDRLPALQSINYDFYRLKESAHLNLPGDNRFGLNFFLTEIEAYPVSPVVG